MPIRVLIVDDSAVVRRILSEALAHESDIQVVGTAPDPVEARTKIETLKPDVVTLDIEMPRMDGLTFLRELMKSRPLPVIMISSLAQNSCTIAMQALEIGAVEVLAKPAGPYSVGDLRLTLASKVRAAARARLVPRNSTAQPLVPKPALKIAAGGGTSNTVIAIGASTGGTEAIRAVLQELPPNLPPIVIVQHIPPVFSRAFADRLNNVCSLHVKEAVDGDTLQSGTVLIAPGDYHLTIRSSAGRLSAEVATGPRVCYQRPSVDVLFRSVAKVLGRNALGVLLTGMGSDGAQGLLEMRRAGAMTFAQDEASCVVYGMPREAARIGAASQVLPLSKVPQAICALAKNNCVSVQRLVAHRR